ncbi:hypothetical protein THRCLA_04385 [Thraustotheca clavata]|uniref:Uncharacterized protein n=1 Tax=Thraustotheca clavata TaxID=74557 RepID=A0A1V9ZZ63_9STRA|nr:hypothetical protein THRCLA_04385 [Thraustotheca clavata]
MCHHDFKLKRRLEGHIGNVTKVQFVSQNMFISGSEDFTIRLWCVDSTTTIHIYNGHEGYISCWLILKNRIWSGAADASIRVWNLDDFELKNVIETSHRKTIQCIIHAGLYSVASASNDGTIELYHSDSFIVLRTINVHTPVYHLEHGNLKPNYLMASTGNGHIILYDLEQNCTTLNIQIHTQWISHFKLKNYYLACVAESILFIIDIRSFDIIEQTDTQQIVIQTIEWLNTNTIISSGKDGIIKLFKFKLPL